MDGKEAAAAAGDLIRTGRAFLGIELGSTRIKASLIGRDHAPLAQGSFEWASRLVDGNWTYSLDEVWAGLRAAFADLMDDCRRRHDVRPTRFAAIGISGMMHGYLAFDADGALLVPFRTWRNTTADRAATELTTLMEHRIPRRWSVAHFYQAVLDDEPHTSRVRFLTTLAGYVHWQLTGRPVLGIGDASGMFPVDPASLDWDAEKIELFDRIVATRRAGTSLRALLPTPLPAGGDGGALTPQGARLLDPSGLLEAGIAFCPPEGDAGTGMVATNSVAVRTGNVSVGTSVFAMIVLESPLTGVHPGIDIVTTPSGDPVAMIHCINGAGEIAAWASVFDEFAAVIGRPIGRDAVFEALLRASLTADDDGGGLLAYNFLAGEPIVGVADGRPMLLRSPGVPLSLANLIRVQIYSTFGALSIGLRELAREGVSVETMYAHGGLFKTAGVAQTLLAAAIDSPVAVSETAAEGGSWGIAVLAAYRDAVRSGAGLSLADYLRDEVFAGTVEHAVQPDPAIVAGYATFLDRYRAGLAVQRVAEVVE